MHRHITAAVIVLACILPAAQAVEVYRCRVNGQMRYQQDPCNGVVLTLHPERTGVEGLRDSEVHAYLDSVERDVYRIGPRQMEQLETVRSHVTILRQLVDG